MRLANRLRWSLPLLALAVAFVIGGTQAFAQSAPIRVVMVDNDDHDPYPAAVGVGYYAFGPDHFTVFQGQPVVFESPSGNLFPHTVSSISWTGRAPYVDLATGQLFNSSPTPADNIRPGDSWTLDTSSLPPAQYLYYCAIHPWMVGTFTVQPSVT